MQADELIEAVDVELHEQLIPSIFKFFEAHPLSDCGAPGTLVHLRENYYPNYNAAVINAEYDELKEFHAGLLRSNYKETRVTEWVKIIDASIYEELPPIYTKYKFKCEVAEIYKGTEIKKLNTFDL